MTVWDLLIIAVRRWYITLICLALIAAAMLAVLAGRPVYFAQVKVVFLAPAAASANAYSRTSDSLVAVAGAVGRMIDGGVAPGTVSDQVTLVDEGIRNGTLVQQPNSGGQWEYSFTRPELDLQAVASTEAQAQAEIDATILRVQTALTDLQDKSGVSAVDRVRTELSPSSPQVYEQSGSRIRSLAVVGIVGVMITLAVVGTLGRPARRTTGSARRRVSQRQPVAVSPR